MPDVLHHRVDMVPESQRCDRVGCSDRKGPGGYCSVLCTEIDRRLTETRALIAERGISPMAAALWAATVSLSDQLTEVNRLECRFRTPQIAG